MSQLAYQDMAKTRYRRDAEGLTDDDAMQQQVHSQMEHAELLRRQV